MFAYSAKLPTQRIPNPMSSTLTQQFAEHASKPLVNVVARHMGVYHAIPRDRCVGNSTALALRAIAHAIQNPGLEIQIVDHVNARVTNDHMRELVEKYIRKMGLVGFTFKKRDNKQYIVFTLWVEA